MTAPRPSTVCFDLGGVFIRICRSWNEGCEKVGLPVRGEWIAETDAALHALVLEHQTGLLDGPAWAHRLSEHLGGLYSAEEILRVHHGWMYGEYADVLALVERLHAADVTTAVLSNTNAEHWAQINDFPTVRAVHHRLASHEIGLAKPDPAAFRALEDAVGASGDAILFFDDLEANVAAASALGWRAVLIDPLTETAPQIELALNEHDL